MFAALHLPSPGGAPGVLVDLAGHFSPVIELTGAHSVVCDVDGLERLIGLPAKVAEELARHAGALGLAVRIALAATPDTALLIARHREGTHVVVPGQELRWLGPLPVGVLPASDEFLEVLTRWGIATLGELAALPPIGLAERLGAEAVKMRLLALGQWTRPLEQVRALEDYVARMDLEQSVGTLEPLLFCISSLLNDLVYKLKRQALACRSMVLRLTLTRGAPHVRTLDLPLPVQETRVLLKQAQLDLEAHPPESAVRIVELRLIPAAPRTLQGGLFRPETPAPDKLHVTIARIAALVGEGHVGTPERLDTHRPDACRMLPDALVAGAPSPIPAERETTTNGLPLRMACRIYRPSLAATVRLTKERPAWLMTMRIRGAVVDAAGPWRTSGEWWAATRWARDEWDVGLDTGALYRIYRELETGRWFVDALYD